jgi:polyhydroxybutyrate depolymerase
MNQTITRRTFLALSVGAGAATLSGCRRARAAAPSVGRASVAAGGRSEEQISVGGVTRRYVRYEPGGLDGTAPVPLVLMLHGRGGNGSIAEWLYEMREQSDTHGFVVVFPDALGSPPTWHSGMGLGGPQTDDVELVRALVEREANARPIDPDRTFVCGHSSGAMMSYRLAAEASDLFPAVGIVAGTAGIRLPRGQTVAPRPARPVSVIHFHGTDDPLVPYAGGSQRGPAGFMSVAESIDLWVTANGCSPAPATETVGVARGETYPGGRDGTEVTLWTIDGGGHGWPKTAGREDVASTPAGIAASALIWEFFAAHPRGTLSRPS